MKIYTLFLTLFIFIISLNAQETNKFDANNKRHGVWEKKFNNGRIRYHGEFNHGKEIGTFKFYSVASSKHPVIIKKFSTVDNTAEVIFYKKDGKLESAGKMNGKKRIGKWIYYHKDGITVMQEEFYVNNQLNGDYKTFFPNKKPTILTTYKNGKLDGNYKRYSIGNALYQDLTYVNGKLDGFATYYNRKTGLIVEKGNYKNDMRVGSWDIFIDGEFSHSEIVKQKPKKQK